MKTAILLFNLGGPDSPENIRPFLKNFFMDKNIIQAPYLVRCLVSYLISKSRSEGAAKTAYAELGGKSPLLENTVAQAKALEDILKNKANGEHKVFVSMRYWHPMAEEVVRHVKAWGADRIVLLPLYPQYSTTTVRSSLEDWEKHAKKAGLGDIPTRSICCWPFLDAFVAASAANIQPVLDEASRNHFGVMPRLLFSAHGLPEKIVAQGDPYQWQCEESARLIAEKLGLENQDWQICYQSRVGPLKWIGPSTEEALEKAAEDRVPVVIYPHAFTQEHVETLVEIGMEYKHLATELGVPGFYKVDTVGTHPDFIEGLAELVSAPFEAGLIAPPARKRLCPAEFSQCPCRA
ncbi:MAG: ferrochelatase [Pseudobdellovibrionaceae bacterium]